LACRAGLCLRILAVFARIAYIVAEVAGRLPRLRVTHALK
jgi:hypothetical protein